MSQRSQLMHIRAQTALKLSQLMTAVNNFKSSADVASKADFKAHIDLVLV